MAKTPPPPPRFGDLDFEPGIPPEPETQDDPFGEDVPIQEPTPESYGSMLGRAIDRATAGNEDSLSDIALADLSEVSGASGAALTTEDADAAGQDSSYDPRFGPPPDDAAPSLDPDIGPADQALALDLSPVTPDAGAADGPESTAIAVAETSAAARAEPNALDLLPSPSPSPGVPARRGLLFEDPLANLLGALAIGLLVAVLPAQQLAKGVVRDQAEAHLVDLENSIERPLGVRAGELEAPQAIANRIQDGTEKARSRFFMIWLAAGLALGVGGGLIRRSA